MQQPHADAPTAEVAVGRQGALEVVGRLLQAGARPRGDPKLPVHCWELLRRLARGTGRGGMGMSLQHLRPKHTHQLAGLKHQVCTMHFSHPSRCCPLFLVRQKFQHSAT